MLYRLPSKPIVKVACNCSKLATEMQHTTVRFYITSIYVTRFAKRGLTLVSSFSTLKDCNSTCDYTTVLKFCTMRFLSLNLCGYKFPHAKLCLFKVQKLDVSIRPLFPNQVTYTFYKLPTHYYHADNIIMFGIC